MQALIVLVLALVALASAFVPAQVRFQGTALNAGAPTFGTKKKTASSAPSFAKAAPTKGAKPAASVSKKFGKDMTWGGRPDPTPEIIVAGASVPFASGSYEPKTSDSLGGFLEASWRYNLRK
jgi:hypothetical protein